MVSISLYKGNLHKVPDVPRKWLMPTRQISVKDFKVLLRRRSRALSRLPNPNPSPNPNPTATDLATNNNNDANHGIEDAIDNGGADAERGIRPQLEDRKGKDGREEENVGDEGAGGGAQLEGGDGLRKMEVDLSDSAVVEAKRKDDLPVENELNVGEEGGKWVRKGEGAGEDAGNPNAQVNFFFLVLKRLLHPFEVLIWWLKEDIIVNLNFF